MLMKRTQIYLPQDLYAQLKAMARQDATSVSEVVRKTLKDKVKEKKHSGVNTLLSLAEIGKKWKIKAPKDLSANLDYYLYGPGSPEWRYLYKKKKAKKVQNKTK